MITVHDMAEMEPIEVVEALEVLSKNLRQSDLDEIEASSGLPPEDVLPTSVYLSSHSFLIRGEEGGEPVAAFGVAPSAIHGIGIVWMLGTEGVRTYGFSIARRTKPYFEQLNAAYPLLWNYIDKRNELSMRWLKWGGFTLHGDAPGNPGFSIFARNNTLV